MGIEHGPTVDAKCDKDTTELLCKSQLTVTTGYLDPLNTVKGQVKSPNIPTSYQTTRDTVRDEGYEQLLMAGVQHLQREAPGCCHVPPQTPWFVDESS